jgi:hypothetical protein
LSLPVEGSKTSKKTHLVKVWKQTGKKPKELEEQPECPQELFHVWEWFLELMPGGGFSWANLDAWGRLSGVNPTAYETRLLSRLQTVYSSAVNGRRNKPSS